MKENKEERQTAVERQLCGESKKYIIFLTTTQGFPKFARELVNYLAYLTACFHDLGSMSIESCPVLRPTWSEFNNFSNYVEKVDKLYKSRYGMVKVVPPPGWKPASSLYATKLNDLLVKGPIEQNIFGKGGVYECLHIQKKSLPLNEYKAKMRVFDKITEGHSAQEVEDIFWKNIVFSPPLYGADFLSSLMDQTAGSWNLSNLDSILKYAIKSKVKGVTNPYCYVGSWKAMFCWHKEDLDLESINYLHEGKSKFWYSIPADQSYILEKEAKNYFPQHFSKCPEYMRHKTTLINPYSLKKKYPELRISKMEHKAGEFMLVLGASYHCGFNFGFNIAEAINYGTKSWLSKLSKFRPCTCQQSSVRASYREILDNLLESPYSSTKEVLEFQRFVLEQQEKEQQSETKVNQIKAVRLEYSKKIKKDRKVKNFRLKGQKYEIQNWASCDKCRQWRKLGSQLRQGASFRCRDIGKTCNEREKKGEEYITL